LTPNSPKNDLKVQPDDKLFDTTKGQSHDPPIQYN